MVVHGLSSRVRIGTHLLLLISFCQRQHCILVLAVSTPVFVERDAHFAFGREVVVRVVLELYVGGVLPAVVPSLRLASLLNVSHQVFLSLQLHDLLLIQLIRFAFRLEVHACLHQDHLLVLFIRLLLIVIKGLSLVNALASHHHVARLAQVAVVTVDADHGLRLDMLLPAETLVEVVVFVHLVS